MSDDGTDPDGPNSGSPGDTGTTDDPTPVLLPNATLGVAKDSQWDDTLDTATFTFQLEHFGTSPALNLSLSEDLNAIFGVGNYTVGTPTLLSGPGTISVNSGFDGAGDQTLIGTGSSLAPGETAALQFVVTVTNIVDQQANGLGHYENQVTVTAEDGDGNVYSDVSVDGTDPDPDMNGDPTTDASPSTGDLTPDATVGVAKNATVAPDQMAVTFDFYLEHFGSTIASNLRLTEDLDAVFGAGNYTIDSILRISGPSTVVANGMFNGSTDRELVATGSSLPPGETARIQITVGLNMIYGAFSNQVTISSTDGEGGTYSDPSISGTDPDPDGDGNPNNDNGPTDFILASGEIHGTVYVDHNNNGLIDTDELAIEGVEIVLTGTDIAGNSINLTTMTLPNGTYSFLNLLPGDYTITEIHPVDFIDGQETLGDGGGSSSNDQFMVTLNLANNFMANGYNFGELGLDPNAVGKGLFLASAGGSTPIPPAGDEGQGETVESVEFSVHGSRLDVMGTSGDESIEVQVGLHVHRILINHVAYDFPASDIRQIDIQASAGQDTVVLRGTTLDDRADVWPGRVQFSSNRYTVNVTSVREISVHGEGGSDRAFLVDSPEDDIFLGAAAFGSMRDTAGTYLNQAFGFSMLTGNAVMGGADRALMYDTAGNDYVQSMPAFTRLQMGVIDLRE